MVPVNTILEKDDSKKNHHHQQQQQKKSVPHPYTNPSKWDRKLKSRLCTIVFGQPTLHFNIGQRVQLANRPVETFGTVAYVGKLDNKKDQFLGVELDRSGKVKKKKVEFFVTWLNIVGSNDGTVDGKQYFITSQNKGIFVKPSQVILI